MNGRNWENVNLVHRARSIDAERFAKIHAKNPSKRITAVDNAMTPA